MTAAAIIDRARVDGVTLALDPAGKLKVRGNDAAVARWLPEVRQHKPALLAILAGTAPAHDPGPCWRRLIVLPTGERYRSTFTPWATLAEVRGWYPGALSIEVEPDPGHLPAGHLASLEPVTVTPAPALEVMQ